jgi:hypothetical protein
MNHRCGCQSAQQCWDNCCCLSPAERLAWARAHGVDPPTVASPAPRTDLEDSVNTRRAASGNLSVEPAACHGAPGTTAVASCCSSRAASASASPTSSAGAASATSSERNDASGAVAALHSPPCRGVAENWQGVAVAVPVIPPAILIVAEPAPFVACGQPLLFSICFDPWVPPPRISAC